MKETSHVIGVDYGTDSVRSVILNAHTGAEISSAIYHYPRWKAGQFCAPEQNQFRQHPLDYVEGLEETIRRCISAAGADVAASVRAISIDTTGSTPIAVDAKGTPLSLLPGFESNPNSMFFLWKDHTSVKEARQINEHAATFPVNYLQFVGGIYSSEWFWAKLLHVLREDAQVRHSIYSWVEHCDWIPFLLTGGTDVHKMKRSRCAAGHKGLWAEEFGGLPPEEFFSSLDPLLAGFRSRLFTETYTSDIAAGTLSSQWASKLGLPGSVLVGVGAFDAHMGAVGGQIEPYFLSKVMGTSTCDMLVAPTADVDGKLVQGICGQVDGSIIPGMLGLEAGQSAFGDTYAWFRELLSWPIKQGLRHSDLLEEATAMKLEEQLTGNMLKNLAKAAASYPVLETDELAVDWLNGRRTPDANQELKAAIVGLNLASDAPRVYRALVESTCFGARSIVERFIENGVPVKGLIGLGGVARKSPYTMQMLADVINMPIRIHRSEQTCAVGAGMFAATVAGIYAHVEDAMHAMGSGFDAEYIPDPQKTTIYSKRYARFKQLGTFIQQGKPSPEIEAV
ncbi:MAG TPA: ribulokinase [Flavitalea sp.]|nr:ribulokinase [Flavitalea sp.]